MGPFCTPSFLHGVGLDFYELVDAIMTFRVSLSEILITAVLLPERAAIKTSSYQNARLAEPQLPKCRVNQHEDQADRNRRDVKSLRCPELNIAQHDGLSLLGACVTRETMTPSATFSKNTSQIRKTNGRSGMLTLRAKLATTEPINTA